MSWVLSFLAKFFVGLIENYRRDQALKETGRDEVRLDQSEKTVEVLARNAEGQDQVDQMTEEQLKDLLTKP